MRVLNFRIASLALTLSILTEALFIAAFAFLSEITEFGTPLNFWCKSFFWFHGLVEMVTDSIVTMGMGNFWHDAIGAVIAFSFAVAQWWLIFASIIWSIRFVLKNTARGTTEPNKRIDHIA